MTLVINERCKMSPPALRCSCAVLGAAIMLLASFMTVSGESPTTPPSLPKSTTTEIDHFDRDHPVNITVYRFTPFNITAEWSLPDHENQTELENFIFHYYKSKYVRVKSMHKKVRLARNVTTYTIKNLKPGTKYSFQVMANYTQGHLPYSIIYTVTTQGFGDDNPCQCNMAGTNRSLQMPCDAVTGQCVCNDKHTLGLHCDHCQDGYLFTNVTGCQFCDCDKDRSHGTCSVDPTNSMVQCNCLQNFGGHRCLYCAPNFHLDGKNCLACQCHGNTKPGTRACQYMTGVCTSCVYNTTGDHCEKCLDGYDGDPIGAKNCTSLDDLPSHQVSDASSLGEVFHRNLGVIVGTCSAVLALVLLIVGVIVYRHWWRWRRRPLQFWTVQLKEDHERVSFSSDQPSYQHVDADGGLLPDVVRYYDQPSGGGWTRTDVKVPTGASGRSRPRTHAGGDSSNPYRSLEA